jgi:RHS repeat-associated protein
VRENGTVSFKASFTGKQIDEETCLYYFNARWYDAELGRFVTEEPARDGTNWYEYCRNNPLGAVDPTGLAPYINGVCDGSV